MQKRLKLTALSTALVTFAGVANAEILASVRPLGFIASSIADGVTQTQILVPPGASPHDYNLKLSDIQKVKSADLVLWIGEDVDSFLTKSVSRLEGKNVLTISELNELAPLLSKAAHHHHDESEHHHHHEHGIDAHGHHHEEQNDLETNWHVWYSPEISRIVAQKVADKLTAQFPNKQERIARNLAEFNRTLSLQSDKIKAQLAPFNDKGFFVFHDAYGYFNDAYGLNQTGYFTINPLVAPGAKTLAHIKEEITEHRVRCLFTEPQFTPKVVESLSKNADVNVGRLDPMGEAVELGPNSYANFLQFTADSYAECLK